MGKEKKLNPADVERKKEAERRRKANAEARRTQREQALKKASVEELKEEIFKIKRLGLIHGLPLCCNADRSETDLSTDSVVLLLLRSCCVCLSSLSLQSAPVKPIRMP